MPVHQQWHGFLFIYFTLKLFIVFVAYNIVYIDPHNTPNKATIAV